MHRKLIWIMLTAVFMFCLAGCGSESSEEDSRENIDYGEQFAAFDKAIDLDFAKEVNEKLAAFGDDPALGMRSAGSPAETEACKYLEGVMKEIGLQNVTVDETTLDCWTFNGANLTFRDAEGNLQTIDLGGYQTQITAKNEPVELVDVDRGTIDDYEGLDVRGKLVLLDIDQEEDWWINYPAYQARLKGARAVIAMQEFAEEGDDRIGVQDICGPADAPALAISKQGADALRAAIKASGKQSVQVTLNADSQVTENGTSHNLYGEIPGTTDETIFVFAHMDGYFHAAYDDANGVGVSMGIAKAMIDSEYTADRTIRFCIHGAEEWGREGSEYDWSAGAYEEIATNHPDWTKGAIAIVNNDGGYAVQGEKYKGTRSSDELISFVKNSIGDLNEASENEWSYDGLSTYTEDFYWTRVGVPAITAGDGEGTRYDDVGYHSSYDSWENLPVDDTAYTDAIRTYGKLVLDLDALHVRPMDFSSRLTNFQESLNEKAVDRFENTLSAALAAAAELEEQMNEAEQSEDRSRAIAMNQKTQKVYKALQDALLGLDFEPEAIIRHDLYEENIRNLHHAIEALEEGDAEKAFDEYLSSVDNAWYQMYFDKATCDYMARQLFEKRDDTWGSGLIEWPEADTGDVVRSLKAKMGKEKADYSAEIKQLRALEKQQKEYLEQVYAAEQAGIEYATSLMQQ